MHSRFSRQSLRFIMPLAIVLAIFALAAWPLVDNLTRHWFVRDVAARGQLLAKTLETPLATLMQDHAKKEIRQMLDNAVQDERLFSIAICGPANKILYATPSYQNDLGCEPLKRQQAEHSQGLLDLPQGPVHITELWMKNEADGIAIGKLILVHDMSFMQRRSSSTKWWIIATFGLLVVIISIITVLIAHLTWRNWNRSMEQMIRGELRD
ncbi:MAG: trehalose-6-phosphate synthase, partial [Burkholderiaceae bacterium]|nr:trehalose-6-phosphate synthase [Burkholderiaceae bacterium]